MTWLLTAAKLAILLLSGAFVVLAIIRRILRDLTLSDALLYMSTGNLTGVRRVLKTKGLLTSEESMALSQWVRRRDPKGTSNA